MCDATEAPRCFPARTKIFFKTLLTQTIVQMKIAEIKIMRGPNYWSVRRPKLIQMKLDLEDMEQRPTNVITGFKERLQARFF